MEEKETGRIEAFSDGVFSIAITLLILDIKVPKFNDLNGRPLYWMLMDQWPSFLSFSISFLTILIMWINHHKLFVHIRRSDSTFLYLNGLLMFCVTFIPFPTAVLAEYLRHPEHREAAIFYCGTYVVLALLYNALWAYASHGHRLLSSAVNEARVRAITEQYYYGPVFYFVAFFAAFWNYYLAVGICLVLAFYFAIPEKVKS